MWKYWLQSMAVESAIRKIRKIEVFKNCRQWTVIKITTIHSTDYNQITMGIWTRWNIVIITTDIFAVYIAFQYCTFNLSQSKAAANITMLYCCFLKSYQCFYHYKTVERIPRRINQMILAWKWVNHWETESN